ncbi:MAG: hypothetical protein AAGJ35_07880 [Myxococcota bacterium]
MALLVSMWTVLSEAALAKQRDILSELSKVEKWVLNLEKVCQLSKKVRASHPLSRESLSEKRLYQELKARESVVEFFE